ncbi:hypothetical protein ACL02T_17680 [Pseudonocardia sp. RS010]|uniref:hypothetical protein n=1 Tax=Pseudonocardia sp. RS010 TaxID=3385979 RepID=UPI0039A0BE3B
MILPDDGLWIVSLCGTRNAVEVVLRAADRPDAAGGQAYNCADDDHRTVPLWAEIVSEFAGDEAMELVGVPSEIAPSALSELLAPDAHPHALVDAEKARVELGYSDAVTARDALAESVCRRRDNPSTLLAIPGGSTTSRRTGWWPASGMRFAD